MSNALAANPIVGAIGWAIVQSLWQGALIGAVTAIVLMVLRRSTANRRYVVGCIGLLAMALAFVVAAMVAARDLRTAASQQDMAASSFVSYPTGAAIAPRADVTTDTMDQPRRRQRTLVVAGTPARVVGDGLYPCGCSACSRSLFDSWSDGGSSNACAALQRKTHHGRLAGAGRCAGAPAAYPASAPRGRVGDGKGADDDRLASPGDPRSGQRARRTAVDQMEAVLAHELAHVRRHDYRVTVPQSTIEIDALPPFGQLVALAADPSRARALLRRCRGATIAAAASSTRAPWPISNASRDRWGAGAGGDRWPADASRPPAARCGGDRHAGFADMDSGGADRGGPGPGLHRRRRDGRDCRIDSDGPERQARRRPDDSRRSGSPAGPGRGRAIGPAGGRGNG